MRAKTTDTEKSTLTKEVAALMPHPEVKGARLKRRVPEPASQDPVAALCQLTRQHRAWTVKAVACKSMQSDRKNRTTGETLKCDLPAEIRGLLLGVHDATKREVDRLESSMERELRAVLIYTEFLSKVYGCGPVVSAYLVSLVDIRQGGNPDAPTESVKLSKIVRFCGWAVDNSTGRLERPKVGERRGYCLPLRTRLFQMFTAMFRNAKKVTVQHPHGATSKYLALYEDVLFRLRTSPDFDAARNTYKGRPAGKLLTQRKAVAKAIHLFLEDLYIVWRALEGLPVWPSFYSAKMGYAHGGQICVNAPRSLSVGEALALVGSVGAQSRNAPSPAEELEDEAGI